MVEVRTRQSYTETAAFLSSQVRRSRSSTRRCLRGLETPSSQDSSRSYGTGRSEVVRGNDKFPWPLTSTVSERQAGTDLRSQAASADRGSRVLPTDSFSFFKHKSCLKPQTPTKGSWKMEGKKGVNRLNAPHLRCFVATYKCLKQTGENLSA